MDEQGLEFASIKHSKDLDYIDIEVDRTHGFKNRVISTMQKHLQGPLPLIHFTNDEVSWAQGAPRQSTGFISSMQSEGMKQFSNVGFIPSEELTTTIQERHKGKEWMDLDYITEEEAKNSPKAFLAALDRIRQEFIHHGLRTNKNRVSGKFSIPAVVIIDGNVHLQAGDDSPVHAQVNQRVSPDKFIGIFQFDPGNVISEYLKGVGDGPKDSKGIAFREELSAPDRKVRNAFLIKIIHNIATHRLRELRAQFDVVLDPILKDKIALAAHELVDIYVVTPEEYDTVFEVTNVEVRKEIDRRRKKYALLRS